MSRLLNPGLGDYADRLTILVLKIADADARGQPDGHFLKEHGEIAQRVPRAVLDRPAFTRLAEVNQALWKETEKLDLGAAAWPHVQERIVWELAESAVLIYQLNEERARLVAELNADGLVEKVR